MKLLSSPSPSLPAPSPPPQPQYYHHHHDRYHHRHHYDHHHSLIIAFVLCLIYTPIAFFALYIHSVTTVTTTPYINFTVRLIVLFTSGILVIVNIKLIKSLHPSLSPPPSALPSSTPSPPLLSP